VADFVGDTSQQSLFFLGVAIIDLFIDMISRRLASIYRMIVDGIESRGWVSAFVLLLIFSLGVLRNNHLPGLYFDAVNPDYLAAKILAGNKYINHFPPWDTFPLLGNYYHGVMHTYFGLVFFKLFGFSVFSLRIAHAIFGFGILLIANMILTRATGSRLFALLITAVLALDPAFVFAFRTQSYITLSPVLFVLVAFYLLLLMRDRLDGSDHDGGSRAVLILSGLLAGWAFYGYFIYSFFLPAFIGIVVHLSRKPGYSTAKMTLCWVAGFALGSILYLIGYGRLWLELGGLSEIFQRASEVNVTGSPIEFYARPYQLFTHAVAALSGNFHHSVIFSQASPTAHGVLKLIVLVAITLIAVPVVAVRKRFDAPLGYILSLITAFFVVSLYFAARIAPHHMILMLPFLYITSGLALHRAGLCFWNDMPIPARKVASAGLVSLLLFLVILNLQQQNITQKQLLETGGVKYYSDAQTLLAEEAKDSPKPRYYVFGEWGFIGSFAFLTAGKVPYNPAMDGLALAQVPCDTELVILFWGQENPLVESFAHTQGRLVTRKMYHQRDGAVAITALNVSDRNNCGLADTHPDF